MGGSQRCWFRPGDAFPARHETAPAKPERHKVWTDLDENAGLLDNAYLKDTKGDAMRSAAAATSRKWTSRLVGG